MASSPKFYFTNRVGKILFRSLRDRQFQWEPPRSRFRKSPFLGNRLIDYPRLKTPLRWRRCYNYWHRPHWDTLNNILPQDDCFDLVKAKIKGQRPKHGLTRSASKPGHKVFKMCSLQWCNHFSDWITRSQTTSQFTFYWSFSYTQIFKLFSTKSM